MNLEQTIIDSIARTLFVDAYAFHCDNGEWNEGNGAPCEGCSLFGHEEGHPQPGGGEDWFDFAPETPSEFVDKAKAFVNKLVNANKASLRMLLVRAEEADSAEGWRGGIPPRSAYARDFGLCLAMMHLGTGVSWFDSHPEFELEVPYGETETL